MRYYDKTTHTEVSEASDTTISDSDGIIDWWFQPIPSGTKILYHTDDLPYTYTDTFLKPTVDVNGVVIEGATEQELQDHQDAIDEALEQVEANTYRYDGMAIKMFVGFTINVGKQQLTKIYPDYVAGESTIYLNASPELGDEVQIYDIYNCKININIDGNGNNILKLDGSSGTSVKPTNARHITCLIFNGSNWVITALKT